MKYSLYDEGRSVLTIAMRALLGFVVGALVYLLFLAIWWITFPYNTAEIEQPLQVLNLNHVVSKSEELHLRLNIDKRSNITPQISRNIVCSDTAYFVLNTLTSGASARPKGSYTTEVKFGIPANIPDGEMCYFQFTNEYRVNPIRTIDKVWKSEVFQVID